MNNTSPRVLNSRYQIETLIGRGGMADVYRALDLALDRTVAVKMLRPDLARDPIFHTRFRREAQSSASLNHPNIVGVYDTGETDISENGGATKAPYIVMEHVDGVTLRHILHGTPTQAGSADEQPSGPPNPPTGSTTQEIHPPPSVDGAAEQSPSDVLGVSGDDATQAVPQVSDPLRQKIDEALGSPLSEQDASRYMSGVLGALNYSHSRGIVHRDIKPSNVMVSGSGEVKVMDFGIARALADSAQTMTQTSAVVGTAQYLSPEQARGEVVDHRSDLYSAGCVLFELLTNRPPFTGESPVSVAYQHVREEAPMVSDFNNRVSPAMESVVAKALVKDPALRFQSADEFNRAMHQALQGVPVDGTPTTQLASVGAADGSFDELVSPVSVGTPLSARTPEDPDIEDYYTDYRQPARPRGRSLWSILLLLLFVAVIAGGIFLVGRALGSQEPVTVPQVENMPRSEAITELTEVGLVPEPELQSHAEVEADHAIGTDPEAGTDVEDGSTITLYISEGTESVRIPDGLIGESQESVRATLEEVGLEVGEVVEQDHESLGEGEVSGTDPEAGTEVDAGSAVNLTLSTGMLQLPSGVAAGEWRNDVEAALSAAGIGYELEWVEADNLEFDGEVLGVELDGETVTSGDSVPNDSVLIILAGYQPEEEEQEEQDPDDGDDEEQSDEEETPEDEAEEDGEDAENEDGSENGSGNNGNDSNGNGNDEE